jgi:hypothetical protein
VIDNREKKIPLYYASCRKYPNLASIKHFNNQEIKIVEQKRKFFFPKKAPVPQARHNKADATPRLS